MVVQQQSLEKQKFSITKKKKTFREINCIAISLENTKRYFHEIFGEKVLWRVNFYTENSEVPRLYIKKSLNCVLLLIWRKMLMSL